MSLSIQHDYYARGSWRKVSDDCPHRYLSLCRSLRALVSQQPNVYYFIFFSIVLLLINPH